MTRKAKPKLFTIGVHGFDKSSFLAALKRAKVDTVVDIRRRRGVRGAEYAFANSARLQAMLGAAGIGYVHMLALAPPESVRDVQRKADRARGESVSQRSELSAEYIRAYRHACLEHFSWDEFDDQLSGARAIALLCVERDPRACHRSSAGEFLTSKLRVSLEHLLP